MELEKNLSFFKEDEQQDKPSSILTEEKISDEIIIELPKVEVYYGWHSKSGRYKNVVKITCMLDGQEFYYLLEDLRDRKQLD